MRWQQKKQWLGRLIGAFFPLVRYEHPVFIEHKKAGEFIRNNISGEYEKINVMAVKSTVCFYANSRCTLFPYADVDRLIEYIKNNKVDYVVVDERYMGFRSNFEELIRLDKRSNMFKMIYEDRKPTLTRIFQVMR